MIFVPNMALRKVRNNIDRLFDKNLTDLIRGIRNNKENEARYITACIEEIKLELRQDYIFIKANAIEKLAYLQMLGYDISWASFNIIEVMASTRYSEKRIGYLAATQCFNDETDVLMLTTNLIRKDLQSANMYDVGVALSGLSCFATTDLARDLVNDVVNLLSSSRTYVRKKAVLLLYKIFLKYPDSLRPIFPRLRDKLEDPDPGVQSAAVNVVCELARRNPQTYLTLHEVFFKLMNSSSNNWMLIKIIKLFGSLVPLESKIGKKLLEPLTKLINETSAMSLLYECINTVIAVLISISAEGPGDYSPSIQLCVQKLGVLIEDSDQNLKYLGLLAMGRILQTHPKAVQAHKDIVLRCLNDKDESIRLRALDLLYGMVSKKNIMEIVKKLMEHVDAAEGSFYRDELLSRIISICSHNNYQYITNFEWYISVLVELTKVEGSKHGVLIAEQIQDVTVRVQSIRHFSVSQMALLVENSQLLLSGNSTQRSNMCVVLLAAAWICGEYAEHVSNISLVLESMLRTKISIVPGELLSVYVQNIGKLYAVLLNKYEAEQDWDGVESLDNLILSKLPEFQYTDHLEAQERACNLVELVKVIEREHSKRMKIGVEVSRLFEGELNPVAAKAQRRVPVPEGLDLDAWINEPELESEEASSDSQSAGELFPTVSHARQYPNEHQQHGSYVNGSAVVSSSHDRNGLANVTKRGEAEIQFEMEESRRRRKFEQESNPYYMKSSDASSLKPSSSGGNMGKLARPNSALSTGRNSSADQAQIITSSATELQSPLEIPGVIGLDRYLKQQESTLSWRNATKVDKKKKKRFKNQKLENGKSKRKGDKTNLSVLSSSDEGGGAEVGTVVHHVNRDVGEMPEDALSSDVEEKQRVDDEFRALDINLDEPLRDDEKLFAPRPYASTNPYSSSGNAPAYQQQQLLKTAEKPTELRRQSSIGLSKEKLASPDVGKTKKSKRKKDDETKKKRDLAGKKRMKSVAKDEDNSVSAPIPAKKKNKKKVDKSVSNDSSMYTCIKSSNKKRNSSVEPIDYPINDVSQQIISFEGGAEISAEDMACFSGAPKKVVEKKVALKKRKSQKDDIGFDSSAQKPYEDLSENEHLKLQYYGKSVDAGSQKAEVSIAFISKSATSTFRGFKVFVLENVSIQLDRGISVAHDDEKGIRLPFELPPKSCAEYSLKFVFNQVDLTQRIRGSLTYFSERNVETVMDFTLNFPALNFLQFATIGSTSYEIILASGELKFSTQKQCNSPLQLAIISDTICKRSNFSVVAVVEDAVSLYAHDSTQDHICVLLKKSSRKSSNSGGSNSPDTPPAASQSQLPSGMVCGGTVTVSVKCAHSASLATAIANEMCEQIARLAAI